jgi:hypothetical protein
MEWPGGTMYHRASLLIGWLRIALGLFVFILLLASVGCREKETSTKGDIQLLDSIVFETGFPVNPMFCGSFMDRKTAGEIVYFADPVTTKKLLYFDGLGHPLDSVPLLPFLDSLDQLAGMSAWNMDTVLFFGSHNNRYVFGGRQGPWSRTVELPSTINGVGSGLEFTHSFLTSSVQRGQLLLCPGIVTTSLQAVYDTLTSCTPLEYLYRLNNLLPRYVSLDPFHPERGMTARLDSFYWKLASGPNAMFEVPSIDCVQGSAFIHSIYSDKVIVIEDPLHPPVSTFQVSSAHTSCSLPAYALTSQSITAYSDSIDQVINQGGCIRSVFFDLPSQKFVVLVVHALPPGSHPKQFVRDRSFSLVLFDKGFKPVGEVAFGAGVYDSMLHLSLRSGTYMLERETPKKQTSGTHVFKKLNLNAPL